MAQHPELSLHSILDVWFGYLLTAIAAIPAAVIGLFLVSKGVANQTAMLVSVGVAVIGGFLAEGSIRLWPHEKRELVILIAGFVLLMIGVGLWARPSASISAPGYRDPGFGTLIWQLLLACLFGGMFYFRRFKDLVWRHKPERGKPKIADTTGQKGA